MCSKEALKGIRSRNVYDGVDIHHCWDVGSCDIHSSCLSSDISIGSDLIGHAPCIQSNTMRGASHRLIRLTCRLDSLVSFMLDGFDLLSRVKPLHQSFWPLFIWNFFLIIAAKYDRSAQFLQRLFQCQSASLQRGGFLPSDGVLRRSTSRLFPFVSVFMF